MATELAEQRETLRHLVRTDPDPRVRHRAHALVLVADGQTVAAVARVFGTAGHRVRAWRERFVAEGREGLVDRRRRGRPPKLGLTTLRSSSRRSSRGRSPTNCR